METSQSAESSGSTSAFSKSEKKKLYKFFPTNDSDFRRTVVLLPICVAITTEKPKKHTQSKIVHTHVANKESPMIWQFHANFIDGWPFHGNPFALGARTFDERNARAFVMCTRIWGRVGICCLCIWRIRMGAAPVSWPQPQLQRRWSYSIFSGYSIFRLLLRSPVPTVLSLSLLWLRRRLLFALKWKLTIIL